MLVTSSNILYDLFVPFILFVHYSETVDSHNDHSKKKKIIVYKLHTKGELKDREPSKPTPTVAN